MKMTLEQAKQVIENGTVKTKDHRTFLFRGHTYYLSEDAYESERDPTTGDRVYSKLILRFEVDGDLGIVIDASIEDSIKLLELANQTVEEDADRRIKAILSTLD